eukprot:1167005-Pleurochrysis_carterae.AAC.7
MRAAATVSDATPAPPASAGARASHRGRPSFLPAQKQAKLLVTFKGAGVELRLGRVIDTRTPESVMHSESSHKFVQGDLQRFGYRVEAGGRFTARGRHICEMTWITTAPLAFVRSRSEFQERESLADYIGHLTPALIHSTVPSASPTKSSCGEEDEKSSLEARVPDLRITANLFRFR